MKKQLFMALSFAALTGTIHQACGMEMNQEENTLSKNSSNPNIKSNFTSSQTNAYDESKNNFIPLTPGGSILTDDGVTKFYSVGKNTFETFTDNKTSKIVDLSDMSPNEFQTVKPPMHVTTYIQSTSETILSERIDELENQSKELDLKFKTLQTDLNAEFNKSVDGFNKKIKPFFDVLNTKEERKRSFWPRLNYFAQGLGYTAIVGAAGFYYYNIFKTGGALPESPTYWFVLGATFISVPNMFFNFRKALFPSRKSSDALKPVMDILNSKEKKKE